MPSDSRSEAARTGWRAECPYEDDVRTHDAETQDHGVEEPFECARAGEQVMFSRMRLSAVKRTAPVLR